jgi:type I restriction enzyme R subunit
VLGYGLAPRTRAERAEAFTYKHAAWLAGLPTKTAATLRALALCGWPTSRTDV